MTTYVDPTVDVVKAYQGAYFNGEEYVDYEADQVLFRRTFERRLKDIVRRRSGGRLLEIGGAYGFFLDLAKAHFDVVGYEVNWQAVRYAREMWGVDMRAGDFLQATGEDIGGPVDVAVMWDVIEHLQRPDRFVAHIGELSKAGALLYLTTGDIGSFLARWRGQRWRMIHPPTHLHYFDRWTIARLLANHGFRVVEIRPVGVARSLDQVLYSVLRLRMKRDGLYNALKRVVPIRWGFSVNTGDIMQVVGERVER